MRVLLVTTVLSPHQLPFAGVLAESLGKDNFRFAATSQLSAERLRLGWTPDMDAPWILLPGESKAGGDEYKYWWSEADVVICYLRLLHEIESRLKQGKLTFYMSERWWKPPIGMARLLHPGFARMTLSFRRLASSPSFHCFPMGHFAAVDMKRIARFPGRMWLWGYFTATPDRLPECDRVVKGIRVLWAGRMLRLKRVDTLIKAFPQFLREQPDATLTLVGDGPERKRLEQLASKLLAAGSYQFLPSMPNPEILELMRRHHIYVLPSNAYEGWGAVMNEAMAEGCAVIASNASGAASSLIRHGENGLLFASGDWKRLGELLCELGGDELRRIRLAQNGQDTITKCWSPTVAAERFLLVSNALITGQPVPVFDDGPIAPV